MVYHYSDCAYLRSASVGTKPRSTRPRVPLVKLGRTKVVKYTMGFIVTVAGIDLIISAESVSHGTVP